MPVLTIQLTCYNGSRYLPYVFASLAKQSFKDFELLVLDNGSSPEEGSAIRNAVEQSGLPIRLERVEETLNFVGGHNRLWGQHTSPLVLLLNDDAFLEPEYLALILDVMQTHVDVGAVGGRMYRWDFDARETNGGRTQTMDSCGLELRPSGAVKDRRRGKQGTALEIVFGVSGCLPLYRRAAIEQTAPDGLLFVSSFEAYKEDVEVAHRLNRAGWKSYVAHGAVAYHRRSYASGRRFTQSVGSQTRSYRNHLAVLALHLRAVDLFRRGWIIFPYEAVKAVFWLVARPAVFLRAWCWLWRQRTDLVFRRKWYATHL